MHDPRAIPVRVDRLENVEGSQDIGLEDVPVPRRRHERREVAHSIDTIDGVLHESSVRDRAVDDLGVSPLLNERSNVEGSAKEHQQQEQDHHQHPEKLEAVEVRGAARSDSSAAQPETVTAASEIEQHRAEQPVGVAQRQKRRARRRCPSFATS